MAPSSGGLGAYQPKDHASLMRKMEKDLQNQNLLSMAKGVGYNPSTREPSRVTVQGDSGAMKFHMMPKEWGARGIQSYIDFEQIEAMWAKTQTVKQRHLLRCKKQQSSLISKGFPCSCAWISGMELGVLPDEDAWLGEVAVSHEADVLNTTAAKMTAHDEFELYCVQSELFDMIDVCFECELQTYHIAGDEDTKEPGSRLEDVSLWCGYTIKDGHGSASVHPGKGFEQALFQDPFLVEPDCYAEPPKCEPSISCTPTSTSSFSCFAGGVTFFAAVLEDWGFNPWSGCRVGEAKNPGPAAMSILGADFLEEIKIMIREMVQQAIREAFTAGPSPSARDGARECNESNDDEGKRKRRRRDGKGEGGKSGQPEQQASGADLRSSDASSGTTPSRGKGKGSSGAARKVLLSDAADKQTKQSGHKSPDKDGWIKVQRAPPVGDFKLRPQDWDSTIVQVDNFASELDSAANDAVFKAVVLCNTEEQELINTMLAGTAKKHSVLTIVLGKCDKAQRIPGKIGDRLCFRDGLATKITSQNTAAPQPTGTKQQQVQIATKATQVISVRVPSLFMEREKWDMFAKNPSKSIVQWCGDHHVQTIDTFAWKEEQDQRMGRQLYGLVRLLQVDVTTILRASGHGGIFIEDISRKTRAAVEWISRISSDEQHHSYLGRALRATGDLGLVVRGKQLGWRRSVKADEAVATVWMLESIPKEWDTDQIKEVLRTSFQNVTLIKQRHVKGWRTCWFRGALQAKDNRDLVPVAVEYMGAAMTLWAVLAPPRNTPRKQRPLRGATMSLEAKRSILDPIAEAAGVTGGTEVSQNAQKEESVAKRPKVEKRKIPTGTKLQSMPGDGSCGFHCFAEGLKILSKDKQVVHPREMRAKVAAHLQRYEKEYVHMWDGTGPSGQKLPSWNEYVEAVSKESAYISEMEIAALCRIYDIRAILVPECASFPPVTFHIKQQKRVIGLWHTHQHLDLLLPDGQTGYPKELLEVKNGPTFGVRVGGAESEAGTVWTSRASQVKGANIVPSSKRSLEGTVWTNKTARSSAAGKRNATSQPDGLDSRPHGTACQRTIWTTSANSLPNLPANPDLEHDIDALDSMISESLLDSNNSIQSNKKRKCPWRVRDPMPVDKIFRCKLCPFQKPVKDAKSYINCRAKHCNTHHEGKGLPGKHFRPMMENVNGDLERFFWKCPICRKGVTKELRAKINAKAFAAMKRAHGAEQHPRIDRARWLKIAKKPMDKAKVSKKHRFQKLNAKVVNHLQAPPVPTTKFRMYIWPHAKCTKKKITGITFTHAWSCRQCGSCFRRQGTAKKHLSRPCVPQSKKTCTYRLNVLQRLRTWAASARQKHGLSSDIISATFDSAAEALSASSTLSASSSKSRV